MRILIVEDYLTTLEGLRMLFGAKFPGARIQVASTIVAARQLIQAALSQGAPYDIVVLDLKLPGDEGRNPEVDTSLSELVAETMPTAIVALISGFEGILEERFEWFIKTREGQVVMRVPKAPSDWPDRLITRLWSYLVERQMNEVFGPELGRTAPSQSRQDASEPLRFACLTYPLTALMGRITQHWEDLDEATQRRVRNVFYVDDKADPVLVSAAPPEPINLEPTPYQNEPRKKRTGRRSPPEGH